jgi:hypothetical protein
MSVSKLPEASDLRSLPLRALVALAWRCARRVEPAALAEVPDFAAAYRSAMAVAERVAKGEPVRGEEAERAADVMAARNEDFDDRPDDLYSAGYAAAYAAKAASTAAFAVAPPGVPDLGQGATAEKLRQLVGAMSGTAAADATCGHASAAAGAADGAIYSKITRTTSWVESPEGRVACEENAARIWADIKKLAALGLGKPLEPGKPVDPGPEGPLGRL